MMRSMIKKKRFLVRSWTEALTSLYYEYKEMHLHDYSLYAFKLFHNIIFKKMLYRIRNLALYLFVYMVIR